MSGSGNRHKVNCRASQLPLAPHSVSRRHLRKAKWLAQDRRQPGSESAKVYKTHCQGRSKRKVILVLTFPFCMPVSPRGSWAVDVLSSALPEPLVRRALEPGPAPSQDAVRGSGKWAQIVHSFSSDHTHTSIWRSQDLVRRWIYWMCLCWKPYFMMQSTEWSP